MNERTFCDAKHETYSVFKIADLPPPRVDLPVDLNGNLRFLLFELILADQLINWQIYPLVDLPVDLNGNLRFLLFELILADVIPSRVDLPVHLNGNFTFLLSELILADQMCHFTNCCSKD